MDGVIGHFGAANALRAARYEDITARPPRKPAGGTDSQTTVGGMKSKVEAAKIVVRSSIRSRHRLGPQHDTLARVLAGGDEGTLIPARPASCKARKRWIGFFHHSKARCSWITALKKRCANWAEPVASRHGALRRRFAAGDDGAHLRRRWDGGLRAASLKFSAKEIASGKLSRIELVRRDDMMIYKTDSTARMDTDQHRIRRSHQGGAHVPANLVDSLVFRAFREKDWFTGSRDARPLPVQPSVLSVLICVHPWLKDEKSPPSASSSPSWQAPFTRGCPWDPQAGSHDARRHAIEEVYELMDAIEAGDDHEMAESLATCCWSRLPLPDGQGARRVAFREGHNSSWTSSSAGTPRLRPRR